MAISCFTIGVFIDIDHLIDFWITAGTLPKSTSELNATLNSYELVFLPLHSWEILLALMILTPIHPAFFGATIGYFFHLLTDLIFNYAKIEGFLFMYRVNQKWRKEIVFKTYYPTEEQERTPL